MPRDILLVLSSRSVPPVFLGPFCHHWPCHVRLSPPSALSFLFTESMSRGWGLLPLQGHVLVGFWVSKVTGKGLLHHHGSSRMSSLPTRLAFPIPASVPPSQIRCPSPTFQSHSHPGVRSGCESQLCLLAGHIANLRRLSFPL